MMRHDLLMLDLDDLAALSNRGNVKRAAKELDRGEPAARIEETDGNVRVQWSDGITCQFPADRVVSRAMCTCPASQVCRHIIRSVLAYQAKYAERDALDSASHVLRSGPWDPGAVADSALIRFFPPNLRRRAAQLLAENLVVELVRGEKPVARFHRLGHTVRFLIAGDPRYTRCDCADEAPCVHALLAIHAFRRLAPGEHAGLIEIGEPAELGEATRSAMENAEAQLLSLLSSGIAHLKTETLDRLRTQEGRLREAGALWHAEILGDLRRQYDHYHSHDARFAPERLVDLLGEFVVRKDALEQRGSERVPRLFIAGSVDTSRTSDLGQTRLVGLGTFVHEHHHSIEITALLQDVSSGKIVGARHVFAGGSDVSASFHDLGRRLVIQGRSLETLGGGQLVIKAGRLSPEHILSVGRSTASVYSQSFHWDELAAPVQAENFAEILARLTKLPPASLRPRRLGEDLQVCAISDVESTRFDARHQCVEAIVCDAQGARARLIHPFTDRGAAGVEALMRALAAHRLLFVAGRATLGANGLTFSPSGLVFQSPEGRYLLQPWLASESELETENRPASIREFDHLQAHRTAVHRALGELAISGTQELALRDLQRLERLALESSGLGLTTLSDALRRLSHAAPSPALLECAMISRLMQELG